jgi:hypothetical protein
MNQGLKTISNELGYTYMDPFNIKIDADGQAVSLTILPTDKGYYKVIYYAAILTAIKQIETGAWELVTTEEIEAGDLPFYLAGKDDRKELVLDPNFVSQVGAAIEAVLAEQD